MPNIVRYLIMCPVNTSSRKQLCSGLVSIQMPSVSEDEQTFDGKRDTKIYNNAQNSIAIQSNIDKLQEWCKNGNIK